MADWQYIVERFSDGGHVVLEGERAVLEIPAAWVPQAAREGDVLVAEVERQGQESRLRFAIDPEATANRRAKLAEKRAKLTRGPKGDLEL